MDYAGLTKTRLQECKDDGFTEEQISKLNNRELRKLDEKLNRFVPGNLAPTTSGDIKELRLVLLGKTGSGKSSTGNLIIGRQVFEESSSAVSCTATIDEAECKIDGLRVRVIDTPGLYDTAKDKDDIMTEIAKLMDRFSDGIHGFLFVYNISNPRFTKEEEGAFNMMKEGLFGDEFVKHCFVLITHGDQLSLQQTDLPRYMGREEGTPFGQLLRHTVGGRVIAIENSHELEYSRLCQRRSIIRLISANVSGVYNNEVLMKYRAEQEATASKVGGNLQSTVPAIENAVFDELKKKTNGEIKKSDNAAIIESVYKQVKDLDSTKSASKGEVYGAIDTVLKDKKKRLTDHTFMELVEQFAVPLITAAGQIIGPALKKIFSKVVTKHLVPFMKRMLKL